MSKTVIDHYKLLNKCTAVVRSCETHEQLLIAMEYAVLAYKRLSKDDHRKAMRFIESTEKTIDLTEERINKG